MDNAHAAAIAEVKAKFEERSAQQRATTSLDTVAKAATFGAVEALLVDIDASVPGIVDEDTGGVTRAEGGGAGTYGVVDEIAARALANGAQVFGVKSAEIPGGEIMAATLRYRF